MIRITVIKFQLQNFNLYSGRKLRNYFLARDAIAREQINDEDNYKLSETRPDFFLKSKLWTELQIPPNGA